MSSAPSDPSRPIGAARRRMRPSEETRRAMRAPAFPDPAMIARLANAFFQAPPVTTESPAHAARPGGPSCRRRCPSRRRRPSSPASRPYAPARTPVGPAGYSADDDPVGRADAQHLGAVGADRPPAADAPAGSRSEVPQPGASAGAFEPGRPSRRRSIIPPFRSFARRRSGGAAPIRRRRPIRGYDADVRAGGVAAAPADNLYFLTTSARPMRPRAAPRSRRIRQSLCARRAA